MRKVICGGLFRRWIAWRLIGGGSWRRDGQLFRGGKWAERLISWIIRVKRVQLLSCRQAGFATWPLRSVVKLIRIQGHSCVRIGWWVKLVIVIGITAATVVTGRAVCHLVFGCFGRQKRQIFVVVSPSGTEHLAPCLHCSLPPPLRWHLASQRGPFAGSEDGVFSFGCKRI